MAGMISTVRGVLALLSGFVIVPWVVAADPPDQYPVEVKIGIVAYQDWGNQQDAYADIFTALEKAGTKAGGPPVRFRLALGSYDEVLHWYLQGTIDAAVTTPGVFTEIMKIADAQGGDNRDQVYRYIGTRGKYPVPPDSRWASDERKKRGIHTRYHSICLVRRDSPIRTQEDLKKGIAEHRVQRLFVHRLSASGGIVPQYVLNEQGIARDFEKCEVLVFPHPKHQTARHGGEGGPGRQTRTKELVGFVWDAAEGDLSKPDRDEAWDQLRKLPFDELDKTSIPENVLVARPAAAGTDGELSKPAEILEKLVKLAKQSDHKDNSLEYGFDHRDDWRTFYEYDKLLRFSEARHNSWRSGGESPKVSLDDIEGLLNFFVTSVKDNTPRLALVLSGGGAKCSYQVGAVKALEEKLADIRKNSPDNAELSKLDIALVVGTSGGAINALPIALGLSKVPMDQQTVPGQSDWEKLWGELDQKDILIPSTRIQLLLGGIFAQRVRGPPRDLLLGRSPSKCLSFVLGFFLVEETTDPQHAHARSARLRHLPSHDGRR